MPISELLLQDMHVLPTHQETCSAYLHNSTSDITDQFTDMTRFQPGVYKSTHCLAFMPSSFRHCSLCLQWMTHCTTLHAKRQFAVSMLMWANQVHVATEYMTLHRAEHLSLAGSVPGESHPGLFIISPLQGLRQLTNLRLPGHTCQLSSFPLVPCHLSL